MIKVITILSLLSCIYLNISSTERGIIPRYGSRLLAPNPSIVNVFPVPVYPYAIIVALNPFKEDNTACLAVFS